MDKKECLYFIAIVPPEPHKAKVTAIKQHFAEKYNSKAALKSPPHITLQMPFKVNDEKLLVIEDSIITYCNGQNPFNIKINGYSCFKPRVIFLNIKESQPLWDMQKGLSKTLQKHSIFHSTHKDNGFHPHMTVAFRDLKPSSFLEGWEEKKEEKIEFEFEANHITLLKHNGRNWEEYKNFFLAAIKN
jgi:2'-5' RNA ligase